jgi:UDP-GlcNAc:undecaprenyl-phosphate GlcNAc-1-phosphate transferase
MSSELIRAGAFGFVASLALVPLTRALAHKKGWVSAPKADRWSKRPVALFGGAAIFLAYLIPVLILVPFAPGHSWSIVAGGGVLFLLGLIDDFITIKPASKLIGQIIGASIAVYLGHRLVIPGFELLSIPLTIFWIVAITNAYNLIDNMDGLAAGVGAISLAFMIAALASQGNATLSIAAMSLLGSLLGFLIFNFNPASIFMGDAGSMFIGFTLAVLALHGDTKKSALAAVAVPCLALLVPLLDITLVSATRILTGRSVAQGGRDHSSHRLVSLGLSERNAVLVLYALAAAAGGATLLVNHSGRLPGLLAMAVIVVAFGLFGVYLSQMTFDTPQGYFEAKEKSWPTQILFQLTFKRRILEVVLDLTLMVFCYCIAYVLRFGINIPASLLNALTNSLPLVIICTFLGFFMAGVYRGIWKFTGPREIGTFFAGSMAGAVGSVFVVVVLYRFEGYSRSVFPIYAMMLFASVSMSRLSFRFLSSVLVSMRPEPPDCVRVVIYGAGDFGEMLVSELRRQNGSAPMKPVGFLDDNSLKLRQQLHGVSVLGGAADIAAVHHKTRFQQVVLSTAKISNENLRLIQDFCSSRGIPVKRYTWVCQDVV